MTIRESPPRHRSSWLGIDLAAMRHNAKLLRSLIGSAGLAPVVKANAYGHGLAAVVMALRDSVDAYCVATLDEAIEVRAIVGGRVLLLYPAPAAGAADAVACGAELTVMSPGDLPPLLAAVPVGHPPVAVHLAIETGLGRGGLSAQDALAVAATVATDGRARLAGIWSHLATPEDDATSSDQVARFAATVEALRAAGHAPPRHLAASGSLICASAPALELVRPGLAVYGVIDGDVPIAAQAQEVVDALRPAMTLAARPLAFSDVRPGDTVGYGGRWRASRHSRVAILPVGYADGYLRGTQPGAAALVRGVRVPVAGVVSMDALAVDVTDVPGVSREDTFVLLGRQGGQAISAGDVARARNTIAWEVLAGMAARMDRVYYPLTGRPDENESPEP